MAYTTPRTWITGETVTAAMLNEQVRDNESYLKAERDKSYIVSMSLTETAVSNTSSETTLHSFTLPGNTLGSDGMIEFQMYLGLANNIGSNKTVTFNLVYATTNIGTVTTGLNNTFSPTYALSGMIKAVGATNSQKGVLFVNGQHDTNTVTAGGAGTSAVDSTANQTLKLTVQFNAASASLSATVYSVRWRYVDTV